MCFSLHAALIALHLTFASRSSKSLGIIVSQDSDDFRSLRLPCSFKIFQASVSFNKEPLDPWMLAALQSALPPQDQTNPNKTLWESFSNCFPNFQLKGTRLRFIRIHANLAFNLASQGCMLLCIPSLYPRAGKRGKDTKPETCYSHNRHQM